MSGPARPHVVYEPALATAARYFIAWPVLGFFARVSTEVMAVAFVLAFATQLAIYGERGNRFGRRTLLEVRDQLSPLFLVLATVWSIAVLVVATLNVMDADTRLSFDSYDVVVLAAAFMGFAAVASTLVAAVRIGRAPTIFVPLDANEPPTVTRADGTQVRILGAEGFGERRGDVLTIVAAHRDGEDRTGPYRAGPEAIHVDAVFDGPPNLARSKLLGYAARWATFSVVALALGGQSTVAFIITLCADAPPPAL